MIEAYFYERQKASFLLYRFPLKTLKFKTNFPDLIIFVGKRVKAKEPSVLIKVKY